MANGGNIEVAKAFVTIVPSLEGSQAEITKELTGLTNTAAEDAGKESGSTFGNNLAAGIKAASATIAAAVAAVTAAAVGVAKGFIDAAVSTAEYGDTVDKTSQKLGISKQKYQELDYVMQLCGTSLEQNQAGFKTLQNKISDATNGGEEALAMFEGLGLTLEDLQTMSVEDVFVKTVNGLQDMEEGADRSALAVDLFGKAGQNLAPLLNMTADEMADAMQTAEDYGMVMSDDAVDASADFVDALTTLKKTFTGLKNSLLSDFLPPMTQVMEGMAAIFAGDDSGIAMIQEGIQGVIDNISAISPQLFILVETIVTSLLGGFGPMLPQVVSSIFTFLNDALLLVVQLIPQLTPVITEGLQGVATALFTALPLLISALIDMVSELVMWLNSGDNIKTLVNGIVQLVSVLAVALSDMLPILLPALIDILVGLQTALMSPDNVMIITNAVLYIIGAVVIALVAALPSIGGAIVNYFVNVYNLITTFGSQIIGWLTPFINGIKNTVTSWFNSIKSFISTTINNILSGITGWLNSIKSSFTTAFDNIKNKVSEIIGKVQGLVSDILSTLASLPQQVVSIGEDIVNGLIGGITNKNSALINSMKDMVSAAVGTAKSKLGIKSPSRVFMGIGEYSAEGFGLGFEDAMGDVKKDMTDSLGGLTTSMTAEVGAYNGAADMIPATTNTYNGGNITINVIGSEGQSVGDLAKAVAYELESLTRRKEAVYG